MRISTSRTRQWILAPALCGVLITGCNTSGGGEAAEPEATPAAESTPLAEDQLRPLLLSSANLGTGYVQVRAETDTGKYNDIVVQGCPSLEKLGASGDEVKFASKATVTFAKDGTATLSEELHSDRPTVLSSKLRSLFGAYTACRSYTMTAGTTPIEVKIAKSGTPKLGDEQFAYTSTMELPSGAQVLKTLAVRKGNVAVMLVGAPALVDRHIEAAVGKLPADD
ncbi:hypothetical protein ACFVYG_22485 [Streptomyces sp. NPDC058256]|uniref:hypothetical protein n=1 Tax=Streptomyces sp. NPDC058256 TaxID=3346408 RepID=UPI0036E1C952